MHTAPQNSTGNEVNMGSRNSEYLNYRFSYVKLTKIVIYSSDASKKKYSVRPKMSKSWKHMACGKQRQQLLFYLRLSVVMNRTKKGAVFFFFKVDIIKLK